MNLITASEYEMGRQSAIISACNVADWIKHLKALCPQSNVKVGDIFKMSWGYDQTNVDYFQVTRVSEKGVFVREIASEPVEGTEGHMSCKVRPVKDNFLDRASWCCRRNENENVETFRRITDWSRPSFNFKGRYFASRVAADSSTYSSWYA